MNLPIVTSSEEGRRAYRSPLRQRQAERTRELILEAFASQIAEEGLRDFTIPQVAKRAGVSLQTVWRHFPSREALADGLEEWLLDLVNPPIPQKPGDFERYIQSVFKDFEEHAPLFLAVIHWRLSGRMARRKRGERVKAFGKALAPITSNLDPSEARSAHAAISHLCSVLTWKTLKEESGLTAKEAAASVLWAVQTLIADLERRNGLAGSRGQGTARPRAGKQPEQGGRP